ncbi:hypothetical protein ONZ45_g10460 [Pleurotus djamor]|nr:hypothetical protein ONZ45_g10460 [Pleurotus djamor]
MQPIVGVLADNSTSRWGRRRPYMIGGSVLCAFAMLLLGYTRPFASIFTGPDNNANDILTVWLAVLAIYLIDFSINAVQAVDRALLVDTLPSEDQAAANAWAARMMGVGSVVGFFVGNVDLPSLLPFLGSAQLQVLSVIGSFLLLATHFITALSVKEKRLLKSSRAVSKAVKENKILREMKDLYTNMLTLPRTIRQICVIQFFAWIGWFPILFYTTIYVGDLYKRSAASLLPLTSSPDFEQAQAELDATATRYGSRALLYSSLLSLLSNVLLPFFVSEANASLRSRPVRGDGFVSRMARLLGWCTRKKIHLATLWAISHLVFALCMLGTFFTGSVFGATVLMAITGFSWAVTQWAPFSLLAEAILTDPSSLNDDANSIRLDDTRTRSLSGHTVFSVDDGEDDASERDVFLSRSRSQEGRKSGEDTGDVSDDEDAVLRQQEERRRAFLLGNGEAQVSRLDVNGSVGHDYNDDERRPAGGLSAKAGIILGIQNVFVVIPQFLVTGMSSIIFAIFDPGKSVLHGSHPGSTASNGTVANVAESARDVASMLLTRDTEPDVGSSNSVVYIFRIGGLSAAIAFILCWRLARELRH